jgi:hypothetical protein
MLRLLIVQPKFCYRTQFIGIDLTEKNEWYWGTDNQINGSYTENMRMH